MGATSTKTYVTTTGAIFGLITIAHIWRAIEDALGIWAWRLHAAL
jgi:hypothetical protein